MIVPQQARFSFRDATRWSFVMNFGQQGISGLATFILAAILGPGSFGTVAIALVYVSFLEMFVIQGYGSAIIQRKDLESKHLDSLFWFIMGSSMVLGGLSVLLSQWWAHLNNASELPPIIAALSLLIPIRGLTVVQQSVLEREMHFKYLAIRANFASIVGGLAGLAMALAGFGVWSLVGLHLVRYTTGMLLLWKLSGWRPGFRFNFSHAKDLIAFSLKSFSGGIFTFAWRNGEVMLIGLFFGPVAVGLYRLANRAVDLLLSLLTRSLQVVALPYLAPSQDDPRELQERMIKCMRVAGALTLPSVALLVATSADVLTILGKDWTAAVGPVRILSLYVVVQTFTLFIGPALVAAGKPQLEAILMMVLGTANILVASTVALLTKNGTIVMQVDGIAWARVGVMALLYMPLKIYFAKKIMRDISARALLTTILPSLSAGVVALVTVISLDQSGVLSRVPIVVSIIVRLIIGGACALAVLYALEPLVRKVSADSHRALRTMIRRLYVAQS